MKKKDIIFTSIVGLGLILLIVAFCTNFWMATASSGSGGVKLFSEGMSDMSKIDSTLGFFMSTLAKIALIVGLIAAIVYLVAVLLDFLKISPKIMQLVKKISAIVLAVVAVLLVISFIGTAAKWASLMKDVPATYKTNMIPAVGGWFALIGSAAAGVAGILASKSSK